MISANLSKSLLRAGLLAYMIEADSERGTLLLYAATALLSLSFALRTACALRILSNPAFDIFLFIGTPFWAVARSSHQNDLTT
jgi:hypothetical protein